MAEYNSLEKIWISRNGLYSLQQRSLLLKRYVATLKKLVLQARNDVVVKQDMIQ